jgi:hypothetical protein
MAAKIKRPNLVTVENTDRYSFRQIIFFGPGYPGFRKAGFDKLNHPNQTVIPRFLSECIS